MGSNRGGADHHGTHDQGEREVCSVHRSVDRHCRSVANKSALSVRSKNGFHGASLEIVRGPVRYSPHSSRASLRVLRTGRFVRCLGDCRMSDVNARCRNRGAVLAWNSLVEHSRGQVNSGVTLSMKSVHQFALRIAVRMSRGEPTWPAWFPSRPLSPSTVWI